MGKQRSGHTTCQVLMLWASHGGISGCKRGDTYVGNPETVQRPPPAPQPGLLTVTGWLGDMRECDGRLMRAEDSCIHPSSAAPTVLPGTSAGTRRPAQPSPMTTGHSGRDPPTVAATACELENPRRLGTASPL
ncbi:hypothetical protein PIB30_107359 [Stylosanthes scabra]|uniref:Uncharacterized protein n=1 Tax=Stylosanthes scabra TaxID=79078 RepID=A0ABU6RZV3_9FABA|nr:hypothetical protein [Stylosanthes scabra]